MVVGVTAELAAMLLVGLPDSIWGYLHHVAGGTPHIEAGKFPPQLEAVEERAT